MYCIADVKRNGKETNKRQGMLTEMRKQSAYLFDGSWGWFGACEHLTG